MLVQYEKVITMVPKEVFEYMGCIHSVLENIEEIPSMKLQLHEGTYYGIVDRKCDCGANCPVELFKLHKTDLVVFLTTNSNKWKVVKIVSNK
jgi:hypothetical protein